MRERTKGSKPSLDDVLSAFSSEEQFRDRKNLDPLISKEETPAPKPLVTTRLSVGERRLPAPIDLDQLDRALGGFSSEERVEDRPKSDADSLSDPALEKEHTRPRPTGENAPIVQSMLVVEPVQGKRSDFRDIDLDRLDQAIDEFSSKLSNNEERVDCPPWLMPLPDWSDSATLQATSSSQPFLNVRDDGNPESSARSTLVGARAGFGVRRPNLTLIASAAAIAVLSVGAIALWRTFFEPKKPASTIHVERPVASNLPSIALPRARRDGVPGALVVAPQSVRPSRQFSSIVGVDRREALRAVVRPPIISPASPTARQISSPVVPAPPPAPPQVTPTQPAPRVNGADRALDPPTAAGRSIASAGGESLPAVRETRGTEALPSGSGLPAAPAPAPPVTTSVEGAPSAVTEIAAVGDLLARYRSAYEQLDARSAKQIWPSVDDGALARAFNGLESQALTFDNCTVELGEGRAVVSCHGTATYVARVGNRRGQTQSREWTFVLRKAEDVWLIQTVQMR